MLGSVPLRAVAAEPFAELMGGNLGIGTGVSVAEPADELVLAPLLPFFLLVFRPFPPFFFGGMVVNLFYILAYFD
jgi:hypothetical protein